MLHFKGFSAREKILSFYYALLGRVEAKQELRVVSA